MSRLCRGLDYSEDEEERVETPIHVIDLEEYEMVELEAEPEMTMWEDYHDDQVVSSDLWEPFCYICREMGHYTRECCFYHPYRDSANRCLTSDETGHYVSLCTTVRVGPSEEASQVFTSAPTTASTTTVFVDYWSRPGFPSPFKHLMAGSLMDDRNGIPSGNDPFRCKCSKMASTARELEPKAPPSQAS
ncbi:unnamed protein product [Arabidopsis arenosa]|uniref:CCHC-type domain-containing protein n=1 Tax=Arabidopsis arenosa TaxID=38785 RepID=A0A8S2A374_ARAAE|nr:unnamed protein product [Arabidopsis arenosa]